MWWGMISHRILKLCSVNPDLVWQWGHQGDDIITPMRNAGLTVATLDYGKEAYTQEWLTLMGKPSAKKPKRTG